MPQKSFIHKKGQQWYGRALVWQEQTIETYVSACWQEEYEEAWLLISDLPEGFARIHTYGTHSPDASSPREHELSLLLMESVEPVDVPSAQEGKQ